MALNLERGVPPDGLVVARKGAATIALEINGKAAHSGLEPEKGRNAALEASHQALQLGTLADPAKQTTVNVTVIESGRATNAIPDHAIVKADVRAFTFGELDRVEQDLQQLVARTLIPDVHISASLTRGLPPWPRGAQTEVLFLRAQKIYSELGRTLTAVSVGSSADVALSAEVGTPSIDGLGMRGGGAHGDDDYADLSSIAPRTYLLARLLMDLGHSPPAKSLAQ